MLFKLGYNPNLSLFFYDDAGSLGDRELQKRGLGGSQNKVSVGLDHRVQVLPFWLAVVVHRYLIWRHQMSLREEDLMNRTFFRKYTEDTVSSSCIKKLKYTTFVYNAPSLQV